ncbi:MAG: acetylxylan esterase [Prolixibacteraceae bacterium]|nr:acetylxylan esterase [Prolixibacteraceae bacterium]
MSVSKMVTVLFLGLFFVQCGMNKSAQKSNTFSTVEKYHAPDHFAGMFAAAEMKYAFSGTSQSDFEKWQKAFRPELKKLLGLDMLEVQLASYHPKTELKSTEDIGYAIRERWLIWTEPDVPLPFILLRPKNAVELRGLVIAPHGHSKNTELYAGIYNDEKERESGESGERNVAIQAVKEGYFAIAPTTRGFGDTRTPEDLKSDATSSCRTLLMHDILVGRTPIGDRVWDVSKLIDWALKNLPVDPAKIVVTGNSGGGTVTLFAAACDTRISVAVPSSYFCTFVGSIGSVHHCDCNYVPGIMQLGEMADVAGLIAPRPFCAVQGIKDNIFPIAESRKAFAHLKQIYAAAGVPENCELYEGQEGHRYYKAGVWPFVGKHFNSK